MATHRPDALCDDVTVRVEAVRRLPLWDWVRKEPGDAVWRRSMRTAGIAALLAGLVTATAGCMSARPSLGASLGCDAGLLVVSPELVRPGATVTVRTQSGGCRAAYPLFLSGPEPSTATTSSHKGVWTKVGMIRPRSNGSFRLVFTLPQSLKPGRYLFVVQAPYPRCPDEASCAVLQGAVAVARP